MSILTTKKFTDPAYLPRNPGALGRSLYQGIIDEVVDLTNNELSLKVNKSDFTSGGDYLNGWIMTSDGYIEQWVTRYYDISTADITGDVQLPRNFPNVQCLFATVDVLQVNNTMSEMDSRFIANNVFWNDGGIQKGRLYAKNIGDTTGVWGITLRFFWKGR